MPCHSARALASAGLVAVLIVLLSTPLASQETRVRVAPELFVPLADNDLFGVGGGASLLLDTDAFPYWTPYTALRLSYISPAAAELEASLFVASGDVGLGLYAYPLPRMKLGAAAGVGIYAGSYAHDQSTTMTGNLFWRLGVHAGYRFTPSLTLSGGVAYTDYRTQTDSFLRGLSATVAVDLGVGGESVEGRAALRNAEARPVFPILAADYASEPFGSLTIENAESAEMRNIRIWFHVEGYSSGPALCGELDYLPRGATATVPLVADFSDSVMGVTETVRVSGAVRIIYELLGEERSSTAETAITVMHRNALQWRDPRVLAAFVSPNDPVVLEVSKYVAGLVRAHSRPEVDAHLQYAMGLFEGLRLAGVAWSEDPQTPYATMHESDELVDYVQYPHQTIAYRDGDSDDLAALYAAMLESVGVPAAIVPLDEEVLVAFRMKRGADGTREMFLQPDDFIFTGPQAWVPLRVALLREGFLQAWRGGVRLIASGKPTEGTMPGELYQVSQAWQRYPPAGVPDVLPTADKLAEEQLRATFESVLELIVAREITPRVERLRASFGPDGGSGRQRNYLGVTFARYGMYEDALAEFRAALELGHRAALVNIGNIAFLTGDYEAAVSWYEQAIERSPRDPIAIIGLARSYYELDRFDEADRYFRMATAIQPDLSDRYVYLSARVSGTEARASTATERRGNMLWDDERP